MVKLLTILLMALSQAAPETGGIEGVVKHTGTNQPLAGVQVTLSRAVAGAAGPKTATTDEAGRFTFKGLAPGQYGILAQRDAYVRPIRGGGTRTLTLAPNQQVKDVALTLVAGGTISGRVLDPNGQPLGGVDVNALQPSYVNGRKTIVGTIGLGMGATTRVRTNDRGEYRLFWFPPGEYFLSVEVPRTPGNATPQSLLYYPGTPDWNAAVALTVREGSELSAIDFTLEPPDTTGTHRISGRVILPEGSRRGSGIVGLFYLYSRDRTQLVLNGASNMANGNFTIPYVPPGAYDLIVGGAIAPRGRVPVIVGEKDIENLTIPVPRTIDFKGRVTVKGAAASFPLSFVRVTLIPDYRMSPYPSSGVTVETLTFPSIVEGKYTVSVDLGVPMGTSSGTGRDAYVEDVRQGDRSIFQGVQTFDDAVVNVASADAPFEVILNTAGATISGVVASTGNNDIAEATVTLVPQAPRRQNVILYKSVMTDGTGKFTFTGVAPGAYKLFAWDTIPTGAHLNAEFLSPFEARGTTVNVTAGQRLEEVKLDLILKETTR